MFRHVVLLQWTSEATDEQIVAVHDGLAALPAAIAEISSYDVGPDAGVNEGNFDVSIVADFATVHDYLIYRDHPVHRALIEDKIVPILAARAAVQHELPV